MDVSQAGQQPMISQCGRYIITFNGEIYNFREIRNKIDKEKGGYLWRGFSDTEVMLAAISIYGLINAVTEFVGMFAFGLWDRVDEVLYLVRDRIGEKPLYYGFSAGVFMFGSELKSIEMCWVYILGIIMCLHHIPYIKIYSNYHRALFLK
jgi:asparagine synthase (glutamine-hydrolysing)